MAFVWLANEQLITPGSTGSFVDVDLSSYIASGATGVILRYENRSTTVNPTMGFRKNGSTDDRKGTVSRTTDGNGAQGTFICGVDGSRILEIYISTTTDLDVYLVGYFDNSAVFNTNAVDKSIGSTGAWTDVDISGDTGGDTAIAAIVETDGFTAMGTRKNGSTDDRRRNYNAYQNAHIIGVDGSEIFENHIVSTVGDILLQGYITTDATFNTNASNYSLGSTGSYNDLTALPVGGTGGFFEVVATDAGGNNEMYIRKNGSTDDFFRNIQAHHFHTAEGDGSRITEGKIQDTDTDFFLVGYATAVVGSSQIKKFISISQANLKKVSSITNANIKKLAGVANV
jgi:hypothetical protein